jgi:putative nucleotidyltransferase with HDIG domain
MSGLESLEILGASIPEIARKLPPFPTVVARVLDELHNPAFSMDALIRIARNDPVISANILATANRVRRINVKPDLDDPFVAASMIGTNQIRRIITTTGMNRFLAADRGAAFLLLHSRAVAIAAQELAMLTQVSTEKAYVAAILHDVGQLCFHILDPEAFQDAYQQSAVDGRLLEREAGIFGANHSQVGAALAEHWALSEDFSSAILHHHEGSVATCQLQAVINLAESLVRALDIPSSPKNRLTRVNRPAMDALGIEWDNPAMMDCYGRCRARFEQATRPGGV